MAARRSSGRCAQEVEQGRRLEHDSVVTIEAGLTRVFPVDHEGPRGRADQVADQPKEGGLATSGRPDQGDEVSAGNVEIDASQRLGLCLTDAEHLAHAPCLDYRCAHQASLRLAPIQRCSRAVMRPTKAIPASPAINTAANSFAGAAVIVARTGAGHAPGRRATRLGALRRWPR